MKIIIPMAGRGTRLRPHTLTTPKPLIPIAGKPIVQRLVEDLIKVCDEKVEEIAFIIGDFDSSVEKQLLNIAADLGSKGVIYHQEVALGTAHAINCAAQSLDGKVLIAFADTLFRADFTLDTSNDGTIWVKQVDNPSAFGVVKVEKDGVISDFIEKPTEPVSDLAIIGIYYFKDGAFLQKELQYLMDNDVKTNGEFGLTDALENMKSKGAKFKPGQVEDWLDCGNKDATIDTNSRYLEYLIDENLVDSSALIDNSTIIPPVFIGEGAKIIDSVVGPYVSIGANTSVTFSVIKESLIQEGSEIEGVFLINSMVGNKVTFIKTPTEVSLGDHTTLE